MIDYVHIAASNSAAEILTTMRNDDLEEGFYFRELGIFAVDPDSGEEQLYLYDNAGQDGEYIPAASENIKVIERLKMIVRLENTPNVTFTASGNPLYLTVDDIDDNAQSPGSLWSSLKISQMIKSVQDGLDEMQPSLEGKPGQFVGFNKEGKPEAQPLPESGVGRSMAGKTVKPTSSTTVVAGEGAEIFNDYREREYSADGGPSQGNVASGERARAEGGCTTASGNDSHAEGYQTIASAWSAHAEGYRTNASGLYAHAGGSRTIAKGLAAFARGTATSALGAQSFAAGYETIAHAGEFVIGGYNVDSSGSDTSTSYQIQTLFIIGNGISNTRSNAFRVSGMGVYGKGAFNSSGADYAELFEWLDGNPDKEDRVGRFVTLDDDRIRLATPGDDYILGVVSGNPSVVGDVYDDQWAGMFVLDVYGRPVYEWRDFPAETMEVPDENGGMKIIEIAPACRKRVLKLNPDYDPVQTYVPRTQRPEWAAVGLLGKLVALDDGTCQPNGWAAVGEGGIATASVEKTKYRVMSRLDESHVRVMIL
nr:peptidase G2 autoproteolytic cleavage domain-containing protein [uncultured Oscillibacter sp.]